MSNLPRILLAILILSLVIVACQRPPAVQPTPGATLPPAVPGATPAFTPLPTATLPAVKTASPVATPQTTPSLEPGDANDQPSTPEPTPSQSLTPPPAILTYAPTGAAVNPFSFIDVVFDRPMDRPTTEAAFSLNPTTPGTFVWQANTLTFRPGGDTLQSDTTYVVTLAPTARDAAGQVVFSYPFTWRFQTSYGQGYGASFGDMYLTPVDLQIVDVAGRRAVQFWANPGLWPHLGFDLYSLTWEQFLARYASFYTDDEYATEQPPIDTAALPLVNSWRPATPAPAPDDVMEVFLPADTPPGLYVLNLTLAGKPSDQLFMVLSANTLVVKQAPDQIVAWVTDFTTQPVPGAAVQLYAQDGRLIAAGTSDADGLFSARPDTPPLIVMAQVEDDITISGLDSAWCSGRDFWSASWRCPRPITPPLTAFIDTDRPVYRPGQTVHFKATVRQDDDALLTIPTAGAPVTVRIVDASQAVLQTYVLATNHFGAVYGDFALPSGAAAGEYALEVTFLGATKAHVFQVQTDRQPEFQIDVTADAQRIASGETTQIMVVARDFAGAPLPQAAVTINTYVLVTEVVAPDLWNDPVYLSLYPHRTVPWLAVGETFWGVTDDAGRFSLNLPLRSQDYCHTEWCDDGIQRQTVYAIEANVADGGRSVSGVAVVSVYNTREQLTLEVGSVTPGQAFTMRLTADTIDGAPVVGRDVTLELLRRSGGYRMYDGGWSYTAMRTLTLPTDDRGRAQAALVVTEPGFYKLKGSLRDAAGHIIVAERWVYATGDQVGQQADWDEALSIGVDQASYAPGATVRVLLESSFGGPAWLSVERGHTRRSLMATLTPPLTVVSLPLQADDAPNVFITVSAWEPQGAPPGDGGDWLLTAPDSRLHTASVNLLAPVSGKRLQVTITPNKTVYGPGETAQVAVRVTNEAGMPVSAEISLSLADESAYALSPELPESIFAAFYRPRVNQVHTYDSMAPRRTIEGNLGGVGDDVVVSRPRPDFLGDAFWQPELVTDFNGEVRLTISLPDTPATWRLTAHAITADTQVGEANISLTTALLPSP